MPVRMLQVLDYLGGEGSRLATIYQIAAAIHNHVTDDLLTIAQFLYQVAQQDVEIDFQIYEVLLQKHCYDFDRGQGDLEVDVGNEYLNVAKKSCSGLLGELMFCCVCIADQLHYLCLYFFHSIRTIFPLIIFVKSVDQIFFQKTKHKTVRSINGQSTLCQGLISSSFSAV